MMNYWNSRRAKALSILLDLSEEKLNAELLRLYRKTAKVLMKDLELYYLKSTTGDSLVSYQYSFNRYYQLLNDLNKELDKLASAEEIVFRKELVDLYETTSSLINEDAHLDTQYIDQQIMQAWTDDGLNWSDRIWKNKELLAERVRENLTNCIAAGKSYQEFTKDLMETFGVSYRESKRLSVTELANARNIATINGYKEAGINEVIIAVQPDCCDHCKEYEGKTYRIDVAPALPEHPNCRCCYIALV